MYATKMLSLDEESLFLEGTQNVTSDPVQEQEKEQLEVPTALPLPPSKVVVEELGTELLQLES